MSRSRSCIETEPSEPRYLRNLTFACPAACLVLTTAFVWSRLTTAAPENHPHTALTALRLQVSSAEEEPYLRDRARRVEGRVLDAQRTPLRARVVLTDTLALAKELRDSFGKGLNRMFEIEPHIEQAAGTDAIGDFMLPAPSLGNKQLFYFADGHAPARRDNAVVRDGVVSWSMGATLARARSKRLIADAEGDSVRLRPVYRGWWPHLEWQDIPPGGALQLDWRQPDGFPFAVATLAADGVIRVLQLPEGINAESSDNSAELRLSGLPAWTTMQVTLTGIPSLVESMPASLSFALGTTRIGRPPTPTTAEATGVVVVKAEAPFSVVELSSPDGARYSCYADAWGEAVFRDVPRGLFTARSSLPRGGSTWSKGVANIAGGFGEIGLFGIDERAESEVGRAVLCGFLSDRTGSPRPGLVFCRSLDQGRKFDRQKADEHGFYRFRNLVPGATYQLVFCTDDGDDHVRKSKTVALGKDAGDIETRLDLVLDTHQLTVELPAGCSAGDQLLLHRADGAAELVWGTQLTAARPSRIRDIAPGAYRLTLKRGGRDHATASAVILADAPAAAIAATAWSIPSSETVQREK